MKLLLIDLSNDVAFARRLSLLVAKHSRGVQLIRASLADYIPHLRDSRLASVLINNDELNETVLNVCKSILRQVPAAPVLFTLYRGELSPEQLEVLRSHGVVMATSYDFYPGEDAVRAMLGFTEGLRIRRGLCSLGLGRLLRNLAEGLATVRLFVSAPGRQGAWIYLLNGVVCHAQHPGEDSSGDGGLALLQEFAGLEEALTCTLSEEPLLPRTCNITTGNRVVFELLGGGGEPPWKRSDTYEWATIEENPNLEQGSEYRQLPAQVTENMGAITQARPPLDPSIARVIALPARPMGLSMGLGALVAIEIRNTEGRRVHVLTPEERKEGEDA